MYVGGETLGYEVILPDGTRYPTAPDEYLFSVLEAKQIVRAEGGGTIKRLTKTA